MSDMNGDLIVTLAKRHIPNLNDGTEYVCLGHFDYARIEKASTNEKTPCQTFRRFRDHSGMKEIYESSNDPEGMQRNYLIVSESGSHPKENESFDFVFMTTITINYPDDVEHELDYYSEVYHNKLEESFKEIKKEVNVELRWGIFYPIAKGDVIIMLYSSDFEASIRVLFELASIDEVHYSYTIPMIHWNWVTGNRDVSNTPSKTCQMRFRATVKDYEGLNKFVKDLTEDKDVFKTTVSQMASFGTDDIEYNLGGFSEQKMLRYLQYITDPERQKQFREHLVFSAELDVPRSI